MNFLLPLLAVLAFFFVARALWGARPQIKPGALRSALKTGAAILVDVREPSEWTAGTAKNAALLPMSDLRGGRKQWNAFLGKNPGKQLLIYCQSGSRSALAAAQLRGEGLNALNAGSLAALERAGWPVCKQRGQR